MGSRISPFKNQLNRIGQASNMDFKLSKKNKDRLVQPLHHNFQD